ncbi:hypothetical protein Hanom_Chr12g01095301 [Helianthus anomalus]
MMVDFARTNGALVSRMGCDSNSVGFSLFFDKNGCQKQGSTIYSQLKKQHFTIV